MTKSIPLSRAAATAAAALGACALACALHGALASPASAFTPTSKAGGESTPLHLNTSTSPAHATSGGGASIVRTIVGLAIVLAVIWGLAWILRQVKNGRGEPNRPSDGLASVAALTLASGRSVHLVRAGSDYVLLGATEHGVAPIHRYTREQAREAGLLEGDAYDPSPVAGLRPDPMRASSPSSSSAAGLRSDPMRASSPSSSSAAGLRSDPMRASSPSSSLVDRLRELTVRR
jgi:flagellar protein FliO/FliZ